MIDCDFSLFSFKLLVSVFHFILNYFYSVLTLKSSIALYKLVSFFVTFFRRSMIGK